MADKYDQMCDCVLISMTPTDVKHLEHSSPVFEEAWKRAKVNTGTRTLSPNAGCRICAGSGQKPLPAPGD